MKRVYSNSHDLCHLFANLTDDERYSRDARTSSGNIYFNNGRIFSYGSHFELGHYETDAETNETILILTSRGYSVTTAKQKRELSSATSHHTQVFVPHSDSKDASIKDWRYDLKALNEKLAKARKPELYIHQIARMKDTITRAFEIAYKESIPLELMELFAVSESEDAQAAIREQIAEQKKRDAERDAISLAKWRDCETSTVHTKDGYSYLRVNRAEQRIETSQYVQIPLRIARAFFEGIDAAIKANDFKLLIGQSLMERYSVNACDPNEIRIGCHKIKMSEIYQIAFDLEWRDGAKRPKIEYDPKRYYLNIDGAFLPAYDAEKITLRGFPNLFVHREHSGIGFVVSEALTGFRVTGADTKDGAIDAAKKVLKTQGKEKFAECIAKTIIQEKGRSPWKR